MDIALRFERLTDAMLPEVIEIERQSNNSAWSERSFRAEVDHPHGVFLCAFTGSTMIGYGGVWLVVDEAHVTTLAVAPEYRRQGIGQRLMNRLLNEAKARGMACSTLEVRASNAAAIALYEKIGYVPTATRKGYYPDNKEDATVMWLYDLERWQETGA